MTSKKKRLKAKEAAINRREAERDRRRWKKHRKTYSVKASQTLKKKKNLSPVERVAQRYDRAQISEEQRERYRTLVRFVGSKTPKVLTHNMYTFGLMNIASLEWFRPLGEWKPRGKAVNTQFRSLADHLLREYPVPLFMYEALLTEHGDESFWVPLFAHAARGGSFYKAVKAGTFPFPLTKRMCHLFSTFPIRTGLVEAVRRAQIQAYGGQPVTLEAILRTRPGRERQGGQEEFWATVFQWFCNHSMIDPHQVGPLFDYIGHRYREARGNGDDFNMKGRSPLALLRGMEEWHHELAVTKRIKASKFEPSGLLPQKWSHKVVHKKGPSYTEKWNIQEILTAKALAAEGREMRHCVYSYGHRVAEGHVSIWSLRCDGDRRVTVEVDNGHRRIIQTAGLCNRSTTAFERRLLGDWADTNELMFGRVRRR